MSRAPFLKVSGLTIRYGRKRAGETLVNAVDHVSLEVKEGEAVGIVGESGSGKSTLARAILGLTTASAVEGVVEVAGRQYAPSKLAALRGGTIAMVFQDPLSYLDPLMRICDQVREAVLRHDRKEGAQARVDELLSLVQIKPEYARHYPHEISGGMRQRTLLAMALACKPRLLIADEPTTALDVTTQKEILDLIGSIRRELGMGLLLISHDLGVVASQCDTVHVMLKGRIIESGTPAQVFRSPVEAYTRTLVAAASHADTHSLPVDVNAEPILQIRNVSKQFTRRKGAPHAVLRNVSLDVRQGETVALVGESGSGKSTLARVALALLTPDSGTVSLRGRQLTGMKERDLRVARIAMYPVFQDSSEAFNPRRTVIELLSQALSVAADLPPEAYVTRAIALLEQVHLTPGANYLGRYPHEMSGGQRQRLAIARALATGARLIIADEPLSGADVSIRGKIVSLLQELQQRHGLAYLFITHDIGLARAFAHRIAVMYQGEIVEEGTAQQIVETPKHPYARQLVNAVPELHAVLTAA